MLEYYLVLGGTAGHSMTATGEHCAGRLARSALDKADKQQAEECSIYLVGQPLASSGLGG